MGILASLLGADNPAAQWAAQNHGWLSSAASGFAQGTNFGEGLANAARLGPAGQLIDEQHAKAAKDEADRQAAINQSAADLQKWPDLVKYVTDTGDTAGAFSEAFKRSTPGYGASAQPDPFTLGPGQTRFAPDGSVLAAIPAENTAQKPPAGYQVAPDGNGLTFIPGGPADPSTAGKTTEATRRNQQLASVIDPELKSLIGDGTTPGTFDSLANGWDMARANTPGAQMLGQGPSAEYQQAQNSLKTIVASYLYSVSGATANPGEVQNQVDVLMPKLNEDPKTTAAKKARLIQMVEAVKAAATGRPINIDDPGGTGGGASTGDPELDRALQQYGG